MSNWFEEFEKRKEEQTERELNYKLEKLIQLVDKRQKIDKYMVKLLEEIIEVYNELRHNACNYDKQDYIFRREQLEKVRYEVLKKEHNESAEAQSWYEYKEEEKKGEVEEEER